VITRTSDKLLKVVLFSRHHNNDKKNALILLFLACSNCYYHNTTSNYVVVLVVANRYTLVKKCIELLATITLIIIYSRYYPLLISNTFACNDIA